MRLTITSTSASSFWWEPDADASSLAWALVNFIASVFCDVDFVDFDVYASARPVPPYCGTCRGIACPSLYVGLDITILRQDREMPLSSLVT